MGKKHDSLSDLDLGVTQPETQVAKVAGEAMAEIEAKLIAAHIERDNINIMLRVADPIIRALALKAIAG